MEQIENKNKIKKLTNDLELEQVSGGFVGLDWNDIDAYIYDELGIKHNRNLSKKDTYYISNTKVPKNFVYTLAYNWRNGKVGDVKKVMSDVRNDILRLENGEYADLSAEKYYKFLDSQFS